MAAGLIIIFTNFLAILLAFKFVGILVLTIYRMLTGDVLRFLIVYIILLYGFATSLFVLVHDGPSEGEGGLQASPGEVCMHVCMYVCMYVCV